MIGPTLPRSAERKLNTARGGRKRGAAARAAGARKRCEKATTAIKKTPSRRVRNDSGADANSNPPAIAAGTPPSANQPTTFKSTSRRLNATRLKLPSSCATVRIGIASRMPKSTTSGGSSTAAPPKPATAASVDARNAPPPSSKRSAGESASGILLFVDEREHARVGEQMIFAPERPDLEAAEDADERKIAERPMDVRGIDVVQAVERPAARAAVEVKPERRRPAEAGGPPLEHLLQVLARPLRS